MPLYYVSSVDISHYIKNLCYKGAGQNLNRRNRFALVSYNGSTNELTSLLEAEYNDLSEYQKNRSPFSGVSVMLRCLNNKFDTKIEECKDYVYIDMNEFYTKANSVPWWRRTLIRIGCFIGNVGSYKYPAFKLCRKSFHDQFFKLKGKP